MLPELEILKKATDDLILEDDKLFDLVKNWDVALDAIEDPVLVVDANCVMKCVNKAMVETFGKKNKDDLIGHVCYKHVCDDEKCSSCFTKGRFFYDSKLKKWFDHKSKSIFGSNNNLIGRICILKDVTEYKNVEDTLRNKLLLLSQPTDSSCELLIQDVVDLDILQNLLDTFAEICGIACVIVDTEGRPITKPSNFCDFCKLLRTKQAGLQLCRRSKAMHYNVIVKTGKTTIDRCKNYSQLLEASVPIYICKKIAGVVSIGHAKFKEIPEDDLRASAKSLDIDADELIRLSKKITHKTHEEFKNIVSFFETMCGYISLLGIQNIQQSREIINRLNVEKELIENKNKFKEIVSILSDWVWQTDENNVYTYCSGRIEDLLGYSCGDMLGKTPFDFMPSETVDDVYKDFTERIGNRDIIVELHSWAVTKNNELRCISTNCVPVFDDHGEFKGYSGASKLITSIYADDECGKLKSTK